jgi:prophage tail gpP-like protein
MQVSNEVSVTIGNEKITGFERVTICTSLETLSGFFELVLTDEIEGTNNFKLVTQAECTIRIGKDLVMTGFIDKVSPKITRDSHTITVRGREKTADLVDCSIVTPPLEYAADSNLLQLVKEWVAPFGIVAIKDYETTPNFKKKFCILAGESVAEVIIRACKLKGIIPVTDAQGRLLLTASGGTLGEDTLAFGPGGNVLEAEADFDYSNRFSKYTFRTQSENSDEVIAILWGKSLEISGSAADPGVKRYRPIVLHADSEAVQTDCKKRAEVEALVRAATSQEAMATVQGWRQDSGKLWGKNMLVPCDIAPCYINQELLTSEVTYTLSDEGTKCRIKLVRPDAFNPGTKFSIKRKSGVSSDTGTIKKQKELGFGFGPGF